MSRLSPFSSISVPMPSRLPAYLLAATLAAAAAPAASAQVTLRNMQLMAHVDEYPPTPGGSGWGYSSCWSYVHGDGREYAVIGVANPAGAPNGTAIYNVTDPANPYRVGFIAGPPSTWREMKSYRNWLYVVTEGTGAGEGLQIIRMTDPEHPALAATYTATFSTSHTVSVDTARALLVCNGTKINAGGGAYPPAGMRMLSLANPETPVEVGWWPGGAIPVPAELYVHDSVPIGNRLYASSIYSGTQRVVDITNPAAPFEISSWTYPGAFYTHNAWPDTSGRWLYVTDEQNGQTLRVFDLSDLYAPALVSEITSNPAAIVHNAHVRGGELYLANYTEGIRALDISDPAHPAEFAYADSYAGPSGGYNGVWGVCPYFPSGTVIASDMNTGLYVYRPVRDYGLIRAQVVDAATAQPLSGIRVFLDVPAESLTTGPDGIVVFAPGPGLHTVTARRFGWFDAAATRTVGAGSRDTVVLALALRPASAFSGTVRSAANQAALEDAEVDLAYTPLHQHTDAAGLFAFGSVPDGLYHLEVRRPGFIPVAFDRQLGPGAGAQTFLLTPAASWDALEGASGWSVGVAGDNATTGIWTRVDPLGTNPVPAGAARRTPTDPLVAEIARQVGVTGLLAAPSDAVGRPGEPGTYHEEPGEGAPSAGMAQPDDDRTPPPGTMCFVTGQGSNPANISEADVDNGRTTLTSPTLNLSGMVIPTIGYWRWFYSNTGESGDWLAVSISNNNGSTWVPVDTTRGLHNEWEEQVIRVADYVAPTTQMKLRFQAADLGPGSVVEAAIDDLVLYDGASQPVGIAPSPAAPLAFRAPWPNPARGIVNLSLRSPGGDLVVEILDLQGRVAHTLFRGAAHPGAMVFSWNGTDSRGVPVATGLYFARARLGGHEAVARVVWGR